MNFEPPWGLPTDLRIKKKLMKNSNASVTLLVPIFKRLSNTINALRHVTVQNYYATECLFKEPTYDESKDLRYWKLDQLLDTCICISHVFKQEWYIVQFKTYIIIAIVLPDLKLDNKTNKLTEWLDLMKMLKQIVPPTYQQAC